MIEADLAQDCFLAESDLNQDDTDQDNEDGSGDKAQSEPGEDETRSVSRAGPITPPNASSVVGALKEQGKVRQVV